MEHTEKRGLKTKLIIALVLSLALVAIDAPVLICEFLDNGLSVFKYYTELSNLFALIACAIFSVAAAVALKRGECVPPRWAKTVKYMATCCLTLTFLVTAFVLTPMFSDGELSLMLYAGNGLYLHLICPVLLLVDFLAFEREPVLPKKFAFYAILPTIAYACVTTLLNILRVLKGPYPFLYVYEQPVYMSIVWFLVIDGGALIIAWLIWMCNSKRKKTAE